MVCTRCQNQGFHDTYGTARETKFEGDFGPFSQKREKTGGAPPVPPGMLLGIF